MTVIVDGLRFYNVIKVNFVFVEMSSAIEVQMEIDGGGFETKETYNLSSVIIHKEKSLTI